MLSIVGSLLALNSWYFGDMIILANSFGVCHIFCFCFLFVFCLFEVRAGSESLYKTKLRVPPLGVQGHCSGHSAVIFHRKTSPKSGKDPI